MGLLLAVIVVSIMAIVAFTYRCLVEIFHSPNCHCRKKPHRSENNPPERRPNGSG